MLSEKNLPEVSGFVVVKTANCETLSQNYIARGGEEGRDGGREGGREVGREGGREGGREPE